MANELRKAFAHYDKEDVRQALMASIALFSRTAKETAHRLSYRYPSEENEKIAEWVEKYLAEEDKSNP